MYFPDLVFDRDRRLNDLSVEWYSKVLMAMREPSLWKLSRSGSLMSIYRFLCLPTFDHPLCVRFIRSAEGIVLHAVMLDGQGGLTRGSYPGDGNTS